MRGDPAGLARFWVYQRERFPLVAHGPVLAAFAVAAAGVSASLRGGTARVGGASLVAALSTVLFFLELRIADEFKDAGDDARHRPHRPVPRGLVSLRELGGLAAGAAVLQLAAALWLSPRLLPWLLLVWGYMAIMAREFFVGPWLKARPLAYLATHAPVVPLIALYATACDWAAAGASPPADLLPFLATAVLNGIVVELGRKVRAPADEEPGVETYSALLGPGKAALAWLAAVTGAAACAVAAASRLEATAAAALPVVALAVVAAAAALRFRACPVTRRARLIETWSGVFTFSVYVALIAAAHLGAAGRGA